MAKTKAERLLNKWYENTETDSETGVAVQHAQVVPDWTRIGFQTQELDEPIYLVRNELDEDIFGALAGWGGSFKCGNAHNTSKGNKTDALISMVEMLTEGRWTAEREAGPRTSILFEAVCRVMEKRDPNWANSEKAIGIKTALSSKDENARKKLAASMRENPQIAAAMRDIELEKAQKRAEKAAQKAGEAAGDVGDFVAGLAA